MHKTLGFIVTAISLWRCSSAYPNCKEIEAHSPALRLKRHLFCDYDEDILPTTGKDHIVFIKVSLLPVSVEMNEHSGTLDFHTWLIMSWQDIHLTWNPSEFEGVNTTYVKSDDIWIPDFTVFNSGDFAKDQTGLPSTDCHLQSDGKLQCAAARVFTTHCPTDFTNWPYDKHNCTLHFGSWVHYGETVNLTFGDIYMGEFRENRVWDVEMSNLTSFSETYEKSWDNMFFLHVGLTRNPMRGGMAYVVPAVVIMMITLTILWLDSRSLERIAISGVTFIAHILLVLDLHWTLPESGSPNIPKILIFLEISLILSTCILILTSFLRKIYSLSSPAPAAVIIMTSTVLNSPIGRLVNSEGTLKNEVTLEDGENDRSATKPNKTWQECAIVFEWLALIIFTMTYFILLVVLLPMAPAHPVRRYVGLSNNRVGRRTNGLKRGLVNIMSALRLIALTVIYVSGFVSTDKDISKFDCKKIKDGTPLYKLKRHIFCDYDPKIRPGHGDTNTTVLDVTIYPKFVKFMRWSGSLQVNSWLFIEWYDPSLTWSPKDHDDIDYLPIRKREVWTPELYTIYPSDGDRSSIPDANCKLSHNGKVQCAPAVKYRIPCVSDYTHWPWDVHNCTLQLGAWAHTGGEVTFGNDSGVIIDYYRRTAEWKISLPMMGIIRETSKLSNNVTFPTFAVSVLLTRTKTAFESIYISPVIILTVVTLTILWLRPGSTERLILCCFNLLAHMMIIRHLHYRVPHSGSDVPNILIFYNNSLIFSSVVMILTCWLQKILGWNREVPVWLASRVSLVLTSKVGQVLSINMMDPKESALLQDDADDNSGLVECRPVLPKWENVVTIIGWLSIFSFGFIYLIMCLVLLLNHWIYKLKLQMRGVCYGLSPPTLPSLYRTPVCSICKGNEIYRISIELFFSLSNDQDYLLNSIDFSIRHFFRQSSAISGLVNMMELFKLITFILIYRCRLASTYETDSVCKIIEDNSPEYQLKRHLFCDYDSNIRPAFQGNKTELKMILRLVFADYDAEHNELQLHTRLHISWNDSFLTWNPSVFNGIELIRVKTSEIWKPEIYSLSPKDAEISTIPNSFCVLNKDGKVICRMIRVFIAPCESNYTHWPYDTHKCTIKIGTPTYTSNEVSAGKGKSGIFVRHYDSHPQWKISIGDVRQSNTSSKISKGNNFEIIGVSFLLNRPYTSLKAVMISPVIILTAVTLTTLWLRPGSTERLILSCLNLLGHLLTIRNIHFSLPDTGAIVPNILIFYTNSLILSTIVLALTCWLQSLLEAKREVPIWLARPVAAILASTPGQFFSMGLMEPRAAALLRDDDDSSSLVNSNPRETNWNSVITVIGWISFSCFVFAYVVMCAVLLR
ncbi:uncharacterized protein LOC135162623 [Diachasmimorpha longicaudata]|uniref:uncharacterized protein LOC135162623 n=1 Tax=Diachasmimorpha longicaudata TaxID=58733 RepID=UPI0030B8EC5B